MHSDEVRGDHVNERQIASLHCTFEIFELCFMSIGRE
jgi:hypothetical protein